MLADEIHITIAVTIWFTSCVLVFTYCLNLWPNWVKIKMNNLKKWLLLRFNKFLESIMNDSVSLSFLLLVIAVILFIILVSVQQLETKEFLEGIQIELFGIIFDIILLVLLFNWINKKGDRNKRIEHYLNEIEDFRIWNSDESKYRIIGNIKRLNREGYSEINLWDCKLSGINAPNGNTDLRGINLAGSNLLQAKFDFCNIFEADFSNTTCHYTNFNQSILHKTKFTNSHLQGAKFFNSSLNYSDFRSSTITDNVDFSKANLKNANFTNATFDSANFDGAEVSESFITDLKNWKLNGNKIFNEYVLVKAPVNGKINAFRYFLSKKNDSTKYLITEYTDIEQNEY